MHKYVCVCSVSCNGTALKLASRFWGFYFLCSPNSPSLRFCTIFFAHSLVALKWPSWTSTGIFNQLIGLVSCLGKARCKSGWLLLPWQRVQTVGRVDCSSSTQKTKPGSMEAQTEFSPQGFSCTMLLKPQELPQLNIIEDVYSWDLLALLAWKWQLLYSIILPRRNVQSVK